MANLFRICEDIAADLISKSRNQAEHIFLRTEVIDRVQRLVIRAPIEDEVVRPHVIRRRRRQRARPAGRDAMPRTPTRDL